MIEGLPKRLRELRTKYNFSQKEVAELVGVSPSIVSAYETGERTPSVDVLLSLSSLYNCSTDYLLGKNTSEPPVILNVNGLSDKQIKTISDLIGFLKEK